MDKCPDPRILGAAKDSELAGRWNCSVKTVRRWRKARGVPAFGAGATLDAQGLVGKLAGELGVGVGPTGGDATIDVTKLTRLEFLELKLREIRSSANNATGVARSQFYKQEREVFAELEHARLGGDKRKIPDLELARLVFAEMVREWAEGVLAQHGEVGAAGEAVPFREPTG